MTERQGDDVFPANLDHQQALQYGKDLARIYVLEQARREELELAYQTLNAIYGNTPDGLAFIDESLTIREANKAFARLLETTPQALIGQTVQQALPIDELVMHLQRSAGDSFELELTITQPTRRSLRANAARVAAKPMKGWVLVLHDQSEHKRLESQKLQFVDLAAHELRTPLAAMMGFAELLLTDFERAPDDEQTTYLEAIRRGGERLSKIIQDLLQFAELSHGHIQPRVACEVNLSDVFNELLAELRPYAAVRNVTLSVREANASLAVDVSSLHSALFQLVMNGIKFNVPDGNVILSARAENDQVLITVRDTGTGVPQADLDAIFTPFFQLEDTHTRSSSGLGLGLSIASRVVRQLGGNLSVESALGAGTTFSLRLPLRPTAPDADLRAQLDKTTQQALVYAHDMQILYRKLQQTNRELASTNAQLEQANKLKTDFLSVISHEMRSPFVAIDLALQTFPRYGTDNLLPEQSELLEQLKQSTQNARQMVDRLVAYAGLLSKQGRLNLELLNVGDLINETISTIRPLSRKRQQSLTTEVTEALASVMADRERVSEAIWHLVHNAIKFTPERGQITVRAFVDAERLVIEVQDTGIGIPQEQQGRLWQAFGQLSDALKRGVEGLGLGLAFVHYVAVAHHGDVILRSAPGEGSTIGFWLPLQSERA